jgi:uncharacterized protein (PEP-CTERM system associated)
MSRSVRLSRQVGFGGPVGRCLGALSAGLCICSAVSGQTLSVVPSLTITDTLTSNRNLQSSSTKVDQVTQISPTVSLTARGDTSLQGSLSYSANGLIYLRDSSLNTVYHSLASSGNLRLFDRLLEGRGGVDVTASASRQAVSAFGTQGGDRALNNDNQTQTFSYSLSPFLRGRLLGEVNYQVRTSYSGSLSGASQVGDSASLNTSAGLSGRLGKIGWGLDVSRATTIPDVGRRTTNSRVGASANYSPDVDLQLSLRAGSEVDNLTSQSSRNTVNWGAGIGWTPTPRTSVRFDVDRRFFGNSHSLSVSHRMARISLTAGDSRSLQQGGTAGRGVVSIYDLFFAQFASVEPDPVKRDILVRNFLAANGLDAGSKVVIDGFLTSSSTVQRSQNLSMAYQGVRTTLTVSALRSQSSRLGDGGEQGDLTNGAVRQQGLSVTMSYRLTSDTSFVVSLSEQRTPGVGVQAGNETRTVVASWATPVGRRSNLSLSVRHTRFDSDTNPYHESAIIGSYRMQF